MGVWRSISLGEQLILIGAALVLLVAEYLLSGVLALSNGGLPLWYVLPSAQAILIIGIRALRPGTSLGVSYGLVLSALVVTQLAPGISDLFFFLHNAGAIGAEVLVDLVTWVGVAVMTAGAVMYWQRGGN
jgi:hypothetical protein